MSRIGIISDTHGRLSEAARTALLGVDYVIHAGDIGDPSILMDLEAIAPTTAVLGNNDYLVDYEPGVNETAHQVINDVRIFVSHFPQDAERAANGGNYDLAIHGHTHVPRDEMRGDCRIINPGSTTRPRGGSKPSVALVEVENGKIESMRFVQV